MGEARLQAASSAQARRSGTQVWKDWRWFALTLVTLLMLRSLVADWNQVPTASMAPTISVGDQIVVDKRAYGLRLPLTEVNLLRWAAPERGDIVTFTSPYDGRLYVKRVVAVGGDTVSLIGNHLTVNGEAASYSTASKQSPPGYRAVEERLLGSVRTIQIRRLAPPAHRIDIDPMTVPTGQLLVLGDNRDESFDSRRFGLIAASSVLGQARAVAFSLDYANGFALRTERRWVGLR